MLTIQQIAFDRAINTLTGLKAQYKIILPDGTEYGTLQVLPEAVPRKRAPSAHPSGTLTGHFLPYIKDMPPGGAAKVPFAEFKPENLRGSMAAWCNKHWGTGASITTIDRVGKFVEIVRLN